MNFPLIDRRAADRPSPILAASCSLSAEARGLLADEMSPGAAFGRLVAARLDADALILLAHALPKRAAVWWGALCFWDAARPAPAEAEDAATRAAVRWAIEPTEANRLDALAPGRASGPGSPAGCLALAASWSSGSLSAQGLPPVATPDDTTARLVAGAVMLASVRGDASAFRERRREFLAIGAEVASGRNLWADGDPFALLGLAPAPAARPGAVPLDALDLASHPLHPIASAR